MYYLTKDSGNLPPPLPLLGVSHILSCTPLLDDFVVLQHPGEQFLGIVAAGASLVGEFHEARRPEFTQPFDVERLVTIMDKV